MNELNKQLAEQVAKDELNPLIERYAENKSLADDYKKLCDADNKKIKEIMAKHDFEFADSDNYTVHYYMQKKESLNEEQAIQILKNNDIKSCIKTVEVLDTDTLESLLYQGLIPNAVVAELNACRTTKCTYALRVNKKKGGK